MIVFGDVLIFYLAETAYYLSVLNDISATETGLDTDGSGIARTVSLEADLDTIILASRYVQNYQDTNQQPKETFQDPSDERLH